MPSMWQIFSGREAVSGEYNERGWSVGVPVTGDFSDTGSEFLSGLESSGAIPVTGSSQDVGATKQPDRPQFKSGFAPV